MTQTKGIHSCHILIATSCSSFKTYGRETHEIELPKITSNNSQPFIQGLTPLFLMTEMMQDSEGTQNLNPTMDGSPGRGISPNNLGWQQQNTNANKTDSEGFTMVGKSVKPIDLLATKQHRTGVWISRETPSKTPYHVEDLQCCFDIIQQIDPQAIVLNHMNNPGSARSISTLAGPNVTAMDYNGYCDIQTFPWGNPRKGKFKTTVDQVDSGVGVGFHT